MASDPSPPKPSRNRFSLILQLALPGKSEDASGQQHKGAAPRADPDSTSTNATFVSSPSPTSPARMTTTAPPTSPSAASSSEGMRLLRKARKLSRVFTSVPSFLDEPAPEPKSAPPPLREVSAPMALARSDSSKRRKLVRTSSSTTTNSEGRKAPAPPTPTAQVPEVQKIVGVLSPRPHVPAPMPASPATKASPPRKSLTRASEDSQQMERPLLAASVSSASNDTRTSLSERSVHSHKTEAAASTNSAKPPPPPPSPAPSATSHHTAPRRTRKTSGKERRRRSVDLSMFSPSPASGSKTPHQNLKRSRSLWTSKPAEEAKDEDEPTAEELARLPLSEKQRYLNVKRARKLMQVFGQEPPPALFQITNVGEEDEDEAMTPLDVNRSSMATLLSFSSGMLLGDSSVANRAKAANAASASSSSLPGDLEAVQVVTVPDKGAADGVPASPMPFAEATTPASPLSPPPTAPTQRSTHESTAEFNARRRRVQKLSRFFGVGYQDLAGLDKEPAPTPPVPMRAISDPVPAQVGAGVDVRVSGPTRFWGLVEGKAQKETDPMALLRELKAAH